ncbi:MAG: ankyrin repeat domain-containing protein [Chloroflexi bacterium]|nr:ankyrin repeat domain-containing protein [Chloroflexota bacterium]
MAIFFDLLTAIVGLFGLFSLVEWPRLRHPASIVSGLALLGGSILAFGFSSWWTLGGGFLVSFLAVAVLGSPYDKKGSRGRWKNWKLANAVHEDCKEEVVSLVCTGADVNCRDKFGNPILAVAVGKGFMGIAIYLVQQGADVNCRVAEEPLTGTTPMHYAACSRSPATVSFLIESGADVNAKSDAGMTPLDWAFGNPHGLADRIVPIIREAGGVSGLGEND